MKAQPCLGLKRVPQACPSFRHQAALSRREVLTLGGAFGLALTLPDFLRSQTQPRPAGAGQTFGQAKSVIVLYLHGGHAQLETWDPKPDGPSPAKAIRWRLGVVGPKG